MSALQLPSLWQRLDSRFDGFSPQLQRVAAYVREHPQAVALESLRGIAAAAGVSPASVTRLLQALDVESWESFQQLHRDWLLSGRDAPFSSKAARVRSQGDAASGDTFDALLAAEQHNLSTGLAPEHRAALRAAAKDLARAERIGVLGLRSCFAAAHSLCYALSLFRPGARQLAGLGAVLYDDLVQFQAGDPLVVISFNPYSSDTVALTRHAREAGLDIIAITDSPLSPVAREAKHVLYANNTSPAYIDSPIGALIVTQALAVEILAEAGEPAHRALRQREELLHSLSVFHPSQGRP